MPKSSSARPAPSSFMRCSICAASSGFSITSDSVSSSLSVPRTRPERASTVRRSWIRSWRSNCRDETLTLANSGARPRTARCQMPSWRAVRSSTNRPRSTIRPISSAIEMNSDGDIRPILGWSQRAKRLEARDRAVLEPDDRLVQDGDLLALDRAAQVGLERQAVGLARAHRRLEHLDAVAADALGVIHRELGVLEHLLVAVRLAVGQRDADRGGEEDLAIVERDRRAQRFAQGLGEGDDAGGLLLGHQDQAELIAGQTRERILRLEQPAEPARQA